MKTFELKVDEQTLNVVVAGLLELPAKVANPVIEGIKKQINEAIAAEEPEVPAKKAKK